MANHRIELADDLKGWRGLAAYGETPPYVIVKEFLSFKVENEIATAGLKQKMNRSERRKRRRGRDDGASAAEISFDQVLNEQAIALVANQVLEWNLQDANGDPLDLANPRRALLGDDTPAYLVTKMIEAVESYYDDEIPDDDDL